MDANPGDIKLKLTSLCNRIGIPAGDQPQPVYLFTQLLPEPVALDHRMPLNVVVILDHSSPAMVDGLPVFKQALKDLVEQLQARDRFSLVSLAGPVIIQAQPVVEKNRLKRQIDRIAITPQPLSGDGLAEGVKQAQTHRSASSISRILIIIADEIQADSAELKNLADQAGSGGMPFFVVGFGNRWQDELWSDLAGRSIQATPGSFNGMIEYAPFTDEIAGIMQRFYRSMHVLGWDVHITQRFIRGVELRQAWRVAPSIHSLDLPFSQDPVMTLRSAELSQEGLAYLVEAVLPPRSAGVVRIAQTEVVHHSIKNVELRQEVDLLAEFSQDMGGTNPLNRYVMNFVEMAQACRLNLTAMAELDAGNRQAAIQKLRQAAAILVSQGHTDLADRIRGEADYNIRQYGQISSEGRKMILFTGRRVTNPEAG